MRMTDEAKMLEILKKSGSYANVSVEDFDKPFSDIGIDSLDLYSFLTELEMEYDIKVDDDDFEALKTMNDIRAYFDKALSSK